MTSSDISTMWKEYCLKSTIVGLRYIVESKRRLYERIGWTLLVVFAAIFVFLMYVSTWYEFVKGPTRIVVDNPRYPLERTDFPAVTICPINKALYNKSVTHTVETLGENSTQEERDQYLKSLFAMSLMRYPYYDQPWKYASSINTSMAQLNKSEISNIMLKLMPTIKEMFEHCWWRGTHFNCEDILRLQRTEEGFCYSFNSKTAERNSMSTINPPFESANGTFKAMRSTSAGKLTGFEFQLKNLEDEYFPMDTRFKGYNPTPPPQEKRKRVANSESNPEKTKKKAPSKDQEINEGFKTMVQKIVDTNEQLSVTADQICELIAKLKNSQKKQEIFLESSLPISDVRFILQEIHANPDTTVNMKSRITRLLNSVLSESKMTLVNVESV
ncbi:hypothetical protein M8J77_016647 [Diaphorina citri]|nr:hypothetical protein M8J77_016647 [Diaphorina citri]